MKKVILVDGNNLLFRSYYATAYNGNFMNNSKGFPTNALFGFANMINKIVLEEKPVYMVVAFDKGKTFRHEKYTDYKGGRIETPDELKKQFPLAKEMLTYMGIRYYEIDNYEADDILGTFASYCDLDDEYQGTIISSDKDLLQLISKEVDIKLLKSKDYIRYNEQTFFEAYGIVPKRVIDLKALMGDSSDNIPGVKGVGEKTALKLLQQYESLDGIYEHIDEIKGALKQKLIDDKDNAYMSYDLATIVRNVPMEICMDDILVKEKDHQQLNALYEELEFYSFLKKEKQVIHKPMEYKIAENLDFEVKGDCAVYLELLGTNYHTASILGMAIYNEDLSLYVPFKLLKQNPEFLTKNIKYTYDLKKTYVALKWQGIELSNVTFDTMIAAYLLDYNVKDDIAYLANTMDFDLAFYENVYGKNKWTEPKEDVIAYHAISKAKFIYESKGYFEKRLQEEEVGHLFEDIEMPLSLVLGDMEYDGVYLDQEELRHMGEDMKGRMKVLEQEIYDLAGVTFNIASTGQLGEVLFERLQLPHGKKTKTGYSTSIDVLNKIKDDHPIVEKVIEYRMLSKLYSTYVEGLLNLVHKDGKIHTIFTQTLTRTGRLSSIEPNLQNIPIRQEYGKLIRKAFVPRKDSVILSGDYSQIELRILASIAKVDSLKDAFCNDEDIHSKTASDLLKIPLSSVTSNERRIAKAVNFGIIYGISGYGLSENLGIPVKEAQNFINNYLETYPGIKEYMDQTIAKAYETYSVKTLMNRKRKIDELRNKNYMIRQQGERIALNTPIQGTSADIIKLAMVTIKKEFEKQNIQSKMILQVHDELVFDVLKDELEKVIQIITDKMENVYPLEVPLKIDVEYGDDWYSAK